MALYYRYMNGLETFSLPVAAPAISVGELKGLIMETGRYGRRLSLRKSITISNEHGEEFADDNTSVLCNSTVVVRRVAGPPADAIVSWPSPKRPRSMQDSGDSSSNSVDPAMYYGYAGKAYANGGGYPPMGSHPVNTMGGNLIILWTADGGRQEERMRWGQSDTSQMYL
ncbi:hypothetical protein ZWY2020_028509 [Hordeum vulgare]|nr:hypothetical protein ZWY2020_028509 [Hordeum vulgare]